MTQKAARKKAEAETIKRGHVLGDWIHCPNGMKNMAKTWCKRCGRVILANIHHGTVQAPKKCIGHRGPWSEVFASKNF